MPPLDLSASSVEITRAICDIPSVSDDETTLADAIEAAVSGHAHLEVIRDGDTIVARTISAVRGASSSAGHIDTVPINDNLPTRDIVIDGEKLSLGVAARST